MRTMFLPGVAILIGGLLGGWAGSGRALAVVAGQEQKPAAGKLDRTVLPIAEPEYKPITEIDARKAGCDDYLPKPIDEDLLLRQIRKYLG
jgi:CheY-like chemotaxis protein